MLTIATACLNTVAYLVKRLWLKGMARKHAGARRVFRHQLGQVV